jgi:ankyrin repeat protein
MQYSRQSLFVGISMLLISMQLLGAEAYQQIGSKYTLEATEELRGYLNNTIKEFPIPNNRSDPAILSQTIRDLVIAGANPNLTTSQNTTPVHFAVEINDSNLIKFLVNDHGANTEVVPGSVATPLMVAASLGHIKALKELINCGANIEAEDLYGYTAIAYAAIYGHAGAIIELLRLGATIQNCEVLMNIAMDPAKELFNTFFSRENAREGESVLHSQVRLHTQMPVVKKAIKLLITHYSKDELSLAINQFDIFKQTPLDIAMINNEPELVDLLLDRGANPLLSKYGVFLAQKFREYCLAIPSEFQTTLEDKLYNIAATNYLGMLAKNPQSAILTKELIIRILSMMFLYRISPDIAH